MITRLSLMRAAVAVGVAGAALAGTAATAAAEPGPPPPPPNCTAADLAGVAAGVSAAMSAYLFTHPDVNFFFTSLKGQPKDQLRPQVEDYVSQRPQVRADLQGIRQPLVDFHNRCG